MKSSVPRQGRICTIRCAFFLTFYFQWLAFFFLGVCKITSERLTLVTMVIVQSNKFVIRYPFTTDDSDRVPAERNSHGKRVETLSATLSDLKWTWEVPSEFAIYFGSVHGNVDFTFVTTRVGVWGPHSQEWIYESDDGKIVARIMSHPR